MNNENGTYAADADPDVDPFDALEAELEVQESEWDPEPGEKVIGRMLDTDWVKAKTGRWLPIVRLEKKDGSVVRVPAAREVIKRKLESEKAQPGDLIGLKYEGLAASKNGGNEYHSYKLAVTRVGERGPDVFVGDRVYDPADDLTADAVSAGENPWDQPVATDAVQPLAPWDQPPAQP